MYQAHEKLHLIGNFFHFFVYLGQKVCLVSDILLNSEANLLHSPLNSLHLWRDYHSGSDWWAMKKDKWGFKWWRQRRSEILKENALVYHGLVML